MQRHYFSMHPSRRLLILHRRFSATILSSIIPLNLCCLGVLRDFFWWGKRWWHPTNSVSSPTYCPLGKGRTMKRGLSTGRPADPLASTRGGERISCKAEAEGSRTTPRPNQARSRTHDKVSHSDTRPQKVALESISFQYLPWGM